MVAILRSCKWDKSLEFEKRCIIALVLTASRQSDAMLKRKILFLVLLLYVSLTSVLAYAQGKVVASIKPLQLIAAAITDGVSTPELLVPATLSPHHFALRPSDVVALGNADLIVWVGPGLETFLVDLMEQGDRDKKVIEVASIREIRLLDQEGHAMEENTDHYDPHVWLSTENARVIASAIHAHLVETDAGNAEVFSRNLQRFLSEMDLLDQALQQQFTDLKERPFAVYHNGTQYLEEQLSIRHAFVLVPDHERQPGIRHLMSLRENLAATRPGCLLEDINTNPATVETVFQNTPVRRVLLDTMGSQQTVDHSAYRRLMEDLSAKIAGCLAD